MKIGGRNWRWSWRRCAPWLALVAFSLMLHLWDLGGRSFHHDEAIHAQAAYGLITSGTYRYDPTYHGPLLYYLTAGAFAIAGDSDFTARLPIALSGVLLIAVAWGLRRPLGARAAWWTGLLATISPLVLFYGRFLRMDVLELLVASAAMVALWRAVNGSSRAWIWVGVWTALAFATKENAFVTAALVGGVTALMMAFTGLREAMPLTLRWVQQHRWGLITASVVAVMVTVPLFTVGFTRPDDWFFPYRAISHWWEMHSVGRVGGPVWFHLPRLGLYEFLPIAAAIAWAVRRGRRMRVLEWSLVLFAVTSVGMYCYLGEKVPWLGVHQVWAFLPLAGLQLARTFGPHGVWWSRTLAGVGLALTVVVSYTANFVLDEITPRQQRVEALHFVQTCPEMLEVIEEGYRLTADGEDAMAVEGEAGWPLSWYFRKTPTSWEAPKPGDRPPLVLCDPEKDAEIRRILGPGYVSERLPLRAWWVMADHRATFSEVLRYIFTRRPWGVVGSTDTILLRYTGEHVEGPRDVPVPAVIAETFGATSASVLGSGWLIEPRGLAVGPDGTVAVADVGLGKIVLISADGRVLEDTVPESLNEPEAVAWTPDGVLVVADTWNHRVLLHNSASGLMRPVPTPENGWYGPRGVSVAPDGTIAVSDTGRKRIVLIAVVDGEPRIETIGGEGEDPGELNEPVGLIWLDNGRLLVCDTGNHRLQVLNREGLPLEVVPLPEAWTDFYSRPQVVELGTGRWLLTDVPGRSLWLVENGAAKKIELGEDGITPTGVARHGNTLYVADIDSRVWAFELPPA
jgi:uncharacterized protein (TIGR03663 family)